MNYMYSARRIAAATLTAALTISGVSTSVAANAAPPAHAASHDKAKHGHKVKTSKHGNKHGNKGTKPSKAEHAVVKVRNTARVLDHLLRNTGRDERLHGLSETSIAAVRANLTADHDALVALVETVETDPTQAATAYASLRSYKVSNYAVAIGQVRMAERMLAYAETYYAEYADTLTVEQQAAYDQALVHLDTALTSALVVRATSDRAALSVIGSELRNALHLFGQVRGDDLD
jgi:hypothetical protein